METVTLKDILIIFGVVVGLGLLQQFAWFVNGISPDEGRGHDPLLSAYAPELDILNMERAKETQKESESYYLQDGV